MGNELDKLFECLGEKYSISDRQVIHEAYLFAQEAHQQQKGASGEPFIHHCSGVGLILAELGISAEVIAAGLVCNVLVDTKVSLEDLEGRMGSQIALLVNEFTKMTAFVEACQRAQESALNLSLRKNFLALGVDIRVVILMLADRLQRMRTLGYLSEERQQQMAQATLDFYAPLANRLGIWQIRWELEDLGFRFLSPEKYKGIVSALGESRSERERQIETIIQSLENLLKENNIKGMVSGRAKNIYSIYSKMETKRIALDEVHDIRGVRVIVADIPACYAVLGVVLSCWRPLPGTFDDYIAAPKENSYQSLHTTIIFDDGKPVEVQIRTQEMHENAEYGIAAQWRLESFA